MDIKLDGTLIGKFVGALENSYSPERFDQMLLTRLSLRRTSYTLANDLRTRFFDVIQAAGREGWTAKVIAGALDANPGNAELRSFARELGLDPVPAEQATSLQKVVTEQSVFHQAEPFLAALDARIAWVCQVVIPGGGGTGILVAPNMVLTNHHVIARALDNTVSASQIVCVFDFKQLKDGRQISPGRRVTLAPKWHVASRPHSVEDTTPHGGPPAPEDLDYAVIRLADPVGDQPVGPTGMADPGAGPRKWLTLSSTAPIVAEHAPIIVLQHPQFAGRPVQEPVQIALGTVLHSPFPDLRLRHDARTLSGSSGSPCFNANLEMIALHHAGEAVSERERPKWNQAIPVRNIVSDLTTRNIERQFWDQSA